MMTPPVPTVPTVKTDANEIEPTTENVLAFATVIAAIRKATKGRKSRVSDLTGAERRTVRRIIERRTRRLNGESPVGRLAPSLSARKMAVSGAEASVLAESAAVWDVPDAELAAALRDLATPFSEWTPEAAR